MSYRWNETSWFVIYLVSPSSFKLILETIGPKTEDLYKTLPCLVCGASASGIHFGAVTCEACKVRKRFSKESILSKRCLSRAFFVGRLKKMHLSDIIVLKIIIVSFSQHQKYPVEHVDFENVFKRECQWMVCYFYLSFEIFHFQFLASRIGRQSNLFKER